MQLLSLSNLSEILLSGSDTRFQNLVSTWLILMIIVIIITFVVSEITRNYSQVDKLWSLLPVAYGWITVSAYQSPRLTIMALLVTLWGLRLSYNFWRKGGYNIIPWKGEEDYRWKIMRNIPLLKGRVRFGLFNFFFISFYQNLLILLFSSPFLLAALHSENHLNITDLFAGIFILVFIITEGIADNQLFEFHQIKKGLFDSKLYNDSLEKGFLTEGLWKYSRHPNFISEQGIWISFYFFSVAASGQWINLTMTGAVLLILLFAGSSRLTEKISSGKYFAYKDYQKKVPRFIPELKSVRNQILNQK
jgi:steroid 5-alpha reductase family enzyme